MSTIVQLSDIHLLDGGALAYGQVDTLGAFRRAVEHLRELEAVTGGIDAILVTGDIADHGQVGAYALFRDLVAPVPAPVYVLPGNHDDREAMRRAFAPDGYLPASGTLDYAVDLGEVVIVALDSHVPNAGHGVVSGAQIDWLDTVLASCRARPVILAMHHPPFASGISFMDAMRLSAPERLAPIVRHHGNVSLVACGHLHRAVTTTWAGVTTVVAPAVCHSVGLDLRDGSPPSFPADPSRVLVHRWDDGCLVTHTSFIDRPAAHRAVAPNLREHSGLLEGDGHG